MGHQFTIENDEAFSMATELAMLRGETVEQAVIAALRARLEAEKVLRVKIARIKLLTADFRETLASSVHSSDVDLLYDSETGLPV